MVKNYKGIIAEKTTISKDTFRIKIKLAEGEKMQFKAGQFVNLLVQPNVRRSYSIASCEDLKDEFELIADIRAGGPGSQFFAQAQVGQAIEFLGALGTFVYNERPNPVAFFATGTGLAPFYAMLDCAFHEQDTQRKTMLYLGFRFEEDIFGLDFLEKIHSEHANFEYRLSLTRPAATWKGHAGRITTYIDEEQIPLNSDIYICGSQQMIADVKQKLTHKGLMEENIFYEKYY